MTAFFDILESSSYHFADLCEIRRGLLTYRNGVVHHLCVVPALPGHSCLSCRSALFRAVPAACRRLGIVCANIQSSSRFARIYHAVRFPSLPWSAHEHPALLRNLAIPILSGNQSTRCYSTYKLKRSEDRGHDFCLFSPIWPTPVLGLVCINFR